LSDVAGQDVSNYHTADLCVSAFGKAVLDIPGRGKPDISISLVSMICHTAAQLAAAYCSSEKIKTVVVLGRFLQGNDIVSNLIINALKFRLGSGINIIIPEKGVYAPTIGAALIASGISSFKVSYPANQ
jgi:pantothenate kinase